MTVNNDRARNWAGCRKVLSKWLWATLGVFLLSTTAVAQPVADQDTLLLVQFDRSCEAHFSLGTADADSTARLVEGRFGSAVDLQPGTQVRFTADDGNFHAPAGTIEFWIKPTWPGNDAESHSVFSCRFGTKGYININMIGKGRFGIALSSGEGEEWRWRRADADVSGWKPGEWHHVACSWGQGQLHVYVDGEEGSRQVADARMPDELPKALTLVGGQTVVDGLRVSRRMFTQEDAKQSMQLALGPAPYRHLNEMTCQPADALQTNGRALLGNRRIPLVVGGLRYRKAAAIRPGASVSVSLNGEYETFQAEVGVDAFSRPEDACTFEVHADGKLLFRSEPVKARQAAQPIRVKVAGVNELTLTTRPAGNVHASMLGVWGNAVVTRRGADAIALPPRPMKPAELEMYRRQNNADDYTFEMTAPASFLLAAKFWEDDLQLDQAPAPGRIGGTLEAFATPGEYEPLNFVVYAVQDLERVAVDVSDLRCGTSVVPKDNIDVRLVLRGLMRNLYTRPPEQSTVVSRFLLANEPVDIPARTMREYHLIVHVPSNAEAGVYSGTVRIAPANQEASSLPVQFEVLPFRFRPLTRKAYGIYYRFPADDQDCQQAEIELADIHAHGAGTLKSPLGIDYEVTDGVPVASFDRLTQSLTLLRKHGFQGALPVSSGCEHAARSLGYNVVQDYEDVSAREQFLGTVMQSLSQLAELSKQYPEFEFLPTHMDEVFGRDRLERYIRLTEAVRQVPSLRVYITLHTSPRPGIEDMMRRCDPYVDVRCYNGHALDDWIRVGHSFEELREELDRSGDEAWTYYNIRGSFFKAEWPRLVNGFYMWTSPLRVHIPWMYYSYNGNPLDDTDGPRERGHDFAYAVPDPTDSTQLIPTRHWEAYREGIDDMRYLCTLEDLIADNADHSEAKAAQVWLDKLRASLIPKLEELESIDKESPILIVLSRRFDGVEYRQFRRQAAAHIQKLLELGTGIGQTR